MGNGGWVVSRNGERGYTRGCGAKEGRRGDTVREPWYGCYRIGYSFSSEKLKAMNRVSYGERKCVPFWNALDRRSHWTVESRRRTTVWVDDLQQTIRLISRVAKSDGVTLPAF